MTAQTIMNPHPVVLHRSDTVGTAAQHILSHHLRHLPVVDEQGRYLGIFGIYSLLRLTLPKAATIEGGLEDLSFISGSLGDLGEHLRQMESESVLVGLRQDIPVVHPDTPLMETVLLLLRARIALPVVERDTGRLVGMISSWEALERIVSSRGDR
jgi:CBS domain-containing protein